MKVLGKLLTGLALVAATAAITFCVTVYELDKSGQFAATGKIEEIRRYLDAYFIDDYDEDAVLAAADKTMGDAGAWAMLHATGDKWSYYISADNAEGFQEQSENTYVGIGITIREDLEAGGFVVTSVMAGSPSEASGVQTGDVLVEVEGESVLDLGQEETVRRVRGEEGTAILLKFLRNGEPYTVSITRRGIETEVAALEMLDDVAWIRIANFDGHAADQTISAVESALKQGARALIFDVRNNPGGFRNELVRILDRLLPEGVLFRSRDYAGREDISMSDEVCVDLPMAVLINENTVSAAEFFAAAMQEYKAAAVVGTQTGGKGNFQYHLPLSDGSIIALSVGKYYTPNGRSLTDVGVTPDIPVEVDDEEFGSLYYGKLAAEDDHQLQRALEAVRKAP